MAITTDSYQNIQYSGSTVSQIGLSKTLDNYTWDEIFDYQYCSMCSGLSRIVAPYAANTNIEDYDVTKLGFTVEITDSWDGDADFKAEQTGIYIYPQGLYSKIIWLRGTRTETDTYQLYDSNMSNFKLVTEWDAPNFIFTLPSPVSTFGACATSWSDDESTVKTTWDTDTGRGSLAYRYRHDGTYDDISISGNVMPYLLYKHNGHYYCQQLRQTPKFFGATIDKSGSSAKVGANNLIYPVEDTTVNSLSFFGGNVASDGFYYETDRSGTAYNPWEGNYKQVTKKYAYCDLDNEDCMGRFAYAGTGPSQYCGLETYFKTKRASLLFWAGCGVKFYADKLYKPIIEDGFVTDFSDDMTTPSDLDNWSGDSNHTVPDAPPSPGPAPGPYDDDPWSGATFAGTGVGGAGAFAKCYYMTSTELANLRTWMNSINVPEGFDPMQQIIGLSQVPVALSGSGPENVVFVNSSAVYDPGVTTRAVDTGVATQQAMGTPISYYLGSVDIVRRMQQRGEPYLDYDCQIELYLPLIGMFSLDTQAVMGRTISAYAVLDPVSGTLAAYAYVSKDGQNLPVAYGSTTIGVDLPISAQQLSVSRAALKQANAQLGASLLSGALTMLAAASSSGKSSGSGAKTSTGSSGLSAAGIREAGSDYMKASQVGNVFGDFMQWGRTIRQLSYGNNTAIAGSFGGSTAQWSYPFTPYIKIIRPRFEKPSNYAHSQGVPCVQTKTIGSCTGFIQCIGADVSGISGATDLELQAIQAALSNGIYAGGGQ